MSLDTDLLATPVTDLVLALQARELSPVELLEASLARIAERDGGVNAFVRVLDEAARRQAGESARRIAAGEPRPLEGVPVPIKDNLDVAGVPTLHGSWAAAEIPATADAAVVARLRAAGAVILGKTNLPELATLPSTESARFGPCRNPWDPERTAGGSSGGAAAAVAAAMVPAAQGSDGGGSLRIPAACCGLFTLKPTRGRLPRVPASVFDVAGLSTDGVITRTVRDAALLLDVLTGPVPGDGWWVATPGRPWRDEVGTSPPSLRIAWTDRAAGGAAVTAPCADAVRDTAALCAELGHTVEETEPTWGTDAVRDSVGCVWASGIAAAATLMQAAGGDVGRLEPRNRERWEDGRRRSAAEVAIAVARLRDWAMAAMRPWDVYDVVLTPTLPEQPIPLGLLLGDDFGESRRLSGRFATLTAWVNITGQPAVQLPLHHHGGLPVGVQGVGRHGEEATLLRLAAQLESARPWAGRRPPAMPVR